MTDGARFNPLVTATEAPPIAEARRWIEGRTFPADRPLIDLCQAVPGYPPAPELRAHLADVVTGYEAARYTPTDGIGPLREALAARTSTLYDGVVDPREVLVTAGCNQAFTVAVMAVARAGENIVLPAPWYFNHKMTLDLLGIEARPLPCLVEDGLVPNPATADALIDAGTRAIVLITPNNPTGAIIPPATLGAFYELCDARGIRLILDETYRDFPDWPDGPPHGLFRQPGRARTLLHLYSFSKVYSLAGYRIGALIGEPELVAQGAKILDCLAICAPHIGQKAALFGLHALSGWVADRRREVAGRMAAFREAMAAAGTGYEIVSMGAYFAYLRHPYPDRTAAAVARGLVDEHNILCLPGPMFGPGQERFLRFAFANVGAEVMDDVARRLGGSAAR